MSSFPFNFLSGLYHRSEDSCPKCRTSVSLSKGRTSVSLSKGITSFSRLDNRPTLSLRVSNAIKKELGGKKICTVLTPEQYKDSNSEGSLRKLGRVKRLASEEIRTLRNQGSLRKLGPVKKLRSEEIRNRTSEFALFDIRTHPNDCRCGNNVCTC